MTNDNPYNVLADAVCRAEGALALLSDPDDEHDPARPQALGALMAVSNAAVGVGLCNKRLTAVLGDHAVTRVRDMLRSAARAVSMIYVGDAADPMTELAKLGAALAFLDGWRWLRARVAGAAVRFAAVTRMLRRRRPAASPAGYRDPAPLPPEPAPRRTAAAWLRDETLLSLTLISLGSTRLACEIRRTHEDLRETSAELRETLSELHVAIGIARERHAIGRGADPALASVDQALAGAAPSPSASTSAEAHR